MLRSRALIAELRALRRKRTFADLRQLAVTGLREAGRLYAGELDLEDPVLSPINGRLPVLERVSVFIGTCDVLLADSRRSHAKAAGREMDLDAGLDARGQAGG